MRAFFRSCALSAPFLILPSLAAAQSKPATAPDPYAAEPIVFDRVDIVYFMKADGTGIEERTVAAKIQSDAMVRQTGVISLGFASASQHIAFEYVRVRRPDGTIIETPLANAMEQPAPVTREAPFYSDLKEEQLPVKSLELGDTLEWKARIITTRSEAPGQFWNVDNFLPEGIVAREESIELHAPADKIVNVWTNPKLNLKPAESTANGEHVWRWQTSQLDPTTGPKAEAAKKAKKAHLLTPEEELDEERGKLPSVAWTTFKSWPDVGAWFRGLEGDRAVPDDEIKQKVAELTAGKATQEEKVRAIYAYVSSQIRYIGVAFGIGRYQPHQAVDVLHNQYGDCKDKAILLSAMLAAAGQPSDVALIGAGVRFNEAVPSPAAFNHAITHTKVDGRDVWLDSTEEVAPYKMMYAALRDRTALLVPASGPAALAQTVKDPPFPVFQTWTAKGTLTPDGATTSHITLTVRGDDELALRQSVRQVSPSQYDEFAQQIFHGIGYQGTTSHADISRPDATEDAMSISTDYRREKSGDWGTLRIVAELAPVDLPRVDETDPPTSSIQLGVPRTNTSTAELALPEGWRVELPEAVHAKTPFATMDITYRFEKGTLYAERKYTVLREKLPASEWKTYKKFQDDAGLGGEPYIQLIRAGGPHPSASSIPTVTDNQEAGRLVELAVQTLQQSYDAKTAKTLLDRAGKLNPTQRRLWAAYGFLAMYEGKVNEAITDFRKELAQDPANLSVYQALAAAQASHGDRDGALQSYRDWIAADPADLTPVTTAAQMLLQQKKPADALALLKKSSTTLSEEQRRNELFQLSLGRAQLTGGEKENGVATLAGLLRSSDDPGMLNDAGYDLADAGFELSLDAERVHIALDSLTRETTSWTLDENQNTLRSRTRLLLATWDTMGWILYKQGHKDEARTWIEAAYCNRPDAEVRRHLEALAPDSSLLKQEDQERRTIPLGPEGTHKGVAEYKLLVGQGHVLRAVPATDKTLPDDETLLKQADLKKLFPAGSDAHLYLRGMLNCHSDKCELVLEP